MFKIIIASLAIAMSLSLIGCASQPKSDMVSVTDKTEISPGASLHVISTRGIVESVKTRNIYSTLPFMVERIYVAAGDRVTEGQVLARLCTTDLALSIAQQNASLESARQSTQNSLEEAMRMLDESTANLSNNTNIHIINAQASLTAAEINLEAAQRSYDNALRDYTTGTHAQIVSAESYLRSASAELERLKVDYANTRTLHGAGIVSQDNLRQVYNALTQARNQYDDARINYENAKEFQQRTLEQLRNSLQSAATSQRSAHELLSASHVAAQQDIERLRSHVVSAQIAANLEPMEIALQLMERQLEDSVITAPINGVVTHVSAREGAVGSGLLFIVEDTDNLKVTTSFREYDISMIEPGMDVVIISAANVEHKGIISRINPSASIFSSIVEFESEILVTSVDTDLRIGATAQVDIIF